jgi:hypothetical protein
MCGAVFISDGLLLKIFPKWYRDQLTVYGYARGPYDGNLKSYIDDIEFNNIFSFRLEKYIPYRMTHPTITWEILEVKRSAYSLADQKLLPIFGKLCKMRGFL